MLKRFLLNAVVLIILERILTGVSIQGGIESLLLAAAVLGLANAIVRPLLLVITLPINFLTLGLFTVVINALMLQLTAAIVPSFFIDGFGWALLTAILFSIVSVGLSMVLD